MLSLLKKDKQEMSLWLKIFFWKEKQSWNNLIFIFETILENVIQSEWFGVSTNCSPSLFETNCSPSLFEKLRIDQINDQEGSWMKIISNYLYASTIVLVSNLFL